MDRAKYSVAIIGAGPAGLSCASILESAGISYVVIDPKEPGGSLHINYDFKNTNGDFENSLDLANSLKFSGLNLLKEYVTNAYFSESWLLCTKSTIIYANHLVIATGVKNADSEHAESDLFLIGPSKNAFLYPYSGKSVCISGGGDNAFEHAVIARNNGASLVTIFARSIRAEKSLVSLAEQLGVVVNLTSTSKPFEVGGKVNFDGNLYDVCLVMHGFRGNCPSIRPSIFEFDQKGRVLNPHIPDKKIMVIGDLASKNTMSIQSSILSGIQAGEILSGTLV